MQLCDFNFPVFWEHVIINEVLSILSRFNLFYLIVYVLFKVIFLRDVTRIDCIPLILNQSSNIYHA